jgi:5-methylcytosine-specific restriction endonuclease McrA
LKEVDMTTIAEMTVEERRAYYRARSARQRSANPERVREITRNSMRRTAAKKAIAEGRKPGVIGRPKVFTEEELREKRNEKSKRYYRKNIIKCRAEAAERERKKRAKIAAGSFIYRPTKKLTAQERRLRDVVLSSNRRAKQKGNGGKYTKADIAELFVKQKGKCTWCLMSLGNENPHVDHKLPLALGGRNDKSNLQLLHQSCNLAKAAKHPIVFAQQNGLLCW